MANAAPEGRPETTDPLEPAAEAATAGEPTSAYAPEISPLASPGAENLVSPEPGSPESPGNQNPPPAASLAVADEGVDAIPAPTVSDDSSSLPPAGPRPPEDEFDEEEEEGGGPVKPFLDHLEDLRWTLIKVVSSIILGMIVCLVAGNQLVAFLTWPLKHAQRMLPASHRKVPLLLGTNEIGRVQFGGLKLPPGSNAVTSLEFVPLAIGTNTFVTLRANTNALPGAFDPDMVVLKNYGPISAFMVALKLALYGGLVVSSPFVIFFIGQFVLPALKVKEKAVLYRVAGFGSVLFLLGVAFCYLAIVQVALMASVQFSQWMGFGADEWRAEDYISFVCKFMLGMGLSFQLPLVILTLVKVGIVDYEALSRYRAYFIVGNLVVSAVVTPSGDPLTMVLMALPLQFLYEVSILIARYWARKDRQGESA